MAFPMITVYSADRTVQRLGPARPAMFTGVQNAVVDLATDTLNQAIIAAPGAGHALWVYGILMQADASAGTVRLEESGGAALTGIIAVSDERGFALPLSGDVAMPWLKLGENQGLSADTVGCSIDGVVVYAIVDV